MCSQPLIFAFSIFGSITQQFCIFCFVIVFWWLCLTFCGVGVFDFVFTSSPRFLSFWYCKQRRIQFQTIQRMSSLPEKTRQEEIKWKSCPQCMVMTEKVHGCNKLNCSICKCKWCWYCGKQYPNSASKRKASIEAVRCIDPGGHKHRH